MLVGLAGLGVYLRLRVPPPERSIPPASSGKEEKRLHPMMSDHPENKLREFLAHATAGPTCNPSEPAVFATLGVIRDKAAAHGDEDLLAATRSLERCLRCEADWAVHCYFAREELGDPVYEDNGPRTLDPDQLEERSPIPPSTVLPHRGR